MPNFGWPCYEGATKEGGYDSANVNLCENLYAQPNQSIGGVPSPLTAPHYAWPRSGAQPAAGCSTSGGGSATGGRFVENPDWPAKLRGAYVFSDYARECIVALPIVNGRPSVADRVAVVTGEPAVAFRIGPGGDIYYIDISKGSIQRLRPTGGNRAPVASFTATPESGQAPLTVAFDASATTDPEGDQITYSWDLDGDGACDDATGVTVSRTYETTGTVAVKLCATDQPGLQKTTTRTITVGSNTPPTFTLTASSQATGWKVGDTITFTATATDAEDGTLPTAAYGWKVDLLHCTDEQESSCHDHPQSVSASGATATIVAPDHDYYAFLRARVTVTDSAGATVTATVDAKPRIANVTVASDPAGVQITAGPTSGPTPRTVKFLENGHVQLIAPETATIGGVQHRFTAWKDGVTTPTREVRAPAGATTYTARYTPVATNTAPTVGAVTASPSTLTLYWLGSGTVQLRASVKDDKGATSVVGMLRSTSGRTYSTTMTRSSGSATDGTWTGTIRLTYSGTEPVRHTPTVTATDSEGASGSASGTAVRVQKCFFFVCQG